MFLNLSLVQNIMLFAFLIFVHLGMSQAIKSYYRAKIKVNSTMLFFAQNTLFILLYSSSFEIGSIFYDPRKSDVAWGIAVNLNLWLYIFLSFTSSLVVSFLSKSKGVKVLILSAFVFAYLPISLILDRPFRVVLILVSGFVGIFVPYFLQTKVIEIKESENLN